MFAASVNLLVEYLHLIIRCTPYTMTMARVFYRADYEAALNQTITIREVLPENHLARFLVRQIAAWDLSALYAQYADDGGPPFAPEVLLAILIYGYMTGVFSSRKLEKATFESIPFRFLAGGYHPDHTTIAIFRTTMFPHVASLFCQVLVLAQQAGLWSMGPVSIDGTKIHADASKHSAVSYERCLDIETQLLTEIQELVQLSEPGTTPAGMEVAAEIQRRLARLAHLEQARQVIEQRAALRDAEEQAAFEAKLADREERARRTGKKPRGKPPTPPTPGPRATDQYNFTDPESRIMKNSTDAGFNQHYNAQVAVEQEHDLILAYTLSNHPNDQAEAVPTLQAIPAAVGKPPAAALDTSYFSERNVADFEREGVTPYMAIGKDHHHTWLKDFFTEQPAPPPDDASLTLKMAYQLQTEIGHAIYRLRKCTVEPVFGIIKETLGFRQFSLRGTDKVTGELGLVSLAYDLKRIFVLQANAQMISDTTSGQILPAAIRHAVFLVGRWVRQYLMLQWHAELLIYQGTS
jgi:transposase